MKSKVEQTKDEMLAKTGEQIIEDLRNSWPNHDKWAGFQWGWWKREDKVHWPRFDGSKEDKPPWVAYSGRHSIGAPAGMELAKSVNTTWFNSLFLLWKIMSDEFGIEKANEIMGYLWLAQAGSIVKLVGKLEAGERNCLSISKMYQHELYIEGCDLDIVEESEEKLVMRILCNWWRHTVERWKDQGIAYEDMGLCKPCIACCEHYGRAINPGISCACTAHPLDTGSYCELVYKLEKSP